MAVSFMLLLPKKNRYAGTDSNPDELGCYTLLCCTPFPASTKEKKDKKKTPSQTIWTIPTERPWTLACSSPTLPLYNPPRPEEYGCLFCLYRKQEISPLLQNTGRLTGRGFLRQASKTDWKMCAKHVIWCIRLLSAAESGPVTRL
ncbi:hypothetical protein J4Q44_G00162970 [Coregonus suidteri]|uniref:Uncharacterized protein n=1 Tax=Coregonus suidteri TaxID=861788 RepID=A0AAN8QQU8_9TELE